MYQMSEEIPLAGLHEEDGCDCHKGTCKRCLDCESWQCDCMCDDEDGKRYAFEEWY